MADPVSRLLEPINFGDIAAPNRVIMAPMTRGRSDESAVPNPLMVEYYVQRAAAGLIITEATGISRTGLGWPDAPGIWNAEQVAGWRQVTDGVHAAGGRIICQLWHMGRLVHPNFLGGAAPLSASATQAPDVAHTYAGTAPYAVAQAMTADDIARTLDDYEAAARNAKLAGFDGVQLHGANGYLIDQFLRDGTNWREDGYGGDVQGRCRFMTEVVERLIAVWGKGLVSVRLSPNDSVQGCEDGDRRALFSHGAGVLDGLGIGMLEMRAPGPDGKRGKGSPPLMAGTIRGIFKGCLALNADFDAASGEAALESGACDAIGFGQPFISNPDLVERLAAGLPWAPNPDAGIWYTGGVHGYTDFPVAADSRLPA